jgi:hypothetical protein
MSAAVATMQQGEDSVLKALENRRRLTPAVLAAAAAAAVIAGTPAPSAEAAGPAVFSFPTIQQAPAPVAGLPAGVRQVAVNSQGTFGLALLADGTVAAWGTSSNSNASGQLGDGTTVNHASPAPVHNLTGITQVSAGLDHALAIGAGGQVWAWGGNTTAALGDGTLVNRPAPQPVPGVTGIIQVSAGDGFSLALRSDGTVWAWGDDGFGELGDGTTAAHRARFQHVPGLTGITQVSASSTGSSFAVRSDGTLFAWGNAANGQLGLGPNAGTFLRVPSPTPVPGLTGVTQVSAGFFHALALANQVTWAWGDNTVGSLGDGTETERDNPEQILSGPATRVVAGYLDSAVARPDGSLVVWGDGTLSPVAYTSLTGVTQVSLGQGINLVLGQSAFATVPSLTGDSQADASAELQAAGLVLGTVGSAVDTSCDNIGVVFRQSPDAGTTVRTGSAVSITIGTRPKTPCP